MPCNCSTTGKRHSREKDEGHRSSKRHKHSHKSKRRHRSKEERAVDAAPEAPAPENAGELEALRQAALQVTERPSMPAQFVDRRQAFPCCAILAWPFKCLGR